METDRVGPDRSSEEWLVGGGEMARVIKGVNWSGTPLGPMASWPQSVRTTVSLVQASNSPISLVWGPGHVQIYNDGYWPICGAKHPTSMGQDFRECWASAFPVIGEAYAKAWSGESAYLEKVRMFLDRHGFLEETWFTFSFSPITDESGGVGGLFHPVTEMTSQMLSERRVRTLRDLASRAGKARTIEEAFALSAQVLAESDLDVPFFLLYAVDMEAKRARLVGQNGLEPGTPVNPALVDLDATSEPLWLVAEVVRTGLSRQIDDAARSLAGMTVGPYPEVPKTALSLPILQPGSEKPVAVMVAGISSRLAMDEVYRGFYDLVAAGIGAALANAGAYESERRTAGALQRAIFNSANFSSIATDAQGVIQIFNVGAERMLGYTAAEVMDTITPADISDPQEVIARAIALSLELGIPINPGFEALVFKASRGIEDIYELTYIRKDGSRFPAVVSVTALRGEQGAIIGYLLIGTDNTARQQVEAERKKLDQRLQQKNVELEEASQMKSEFLANMSHELRTPLNAIIGFSEVLRDGLIGDLTDQQRGFIGDIFGSGKHLLSLINDILDLSKVEAGKMVLDLEPVSVSTLFANSLSIIREKAASHHIRLDLDPDAVEALGSIQADPRKLKQILYNLLSNAVKFTADGGHVTLRASRVPRADVGRPRASCASRAFPLADNAFAEFLEIRVADSGIGISPAGLERLFRPFSQIDSGLARKFEGTGLGLAMVKLLTELHGGTVAVESGAGEGSCFTVWLPLRAVVEEALTPNQVSAAPGNDTPAGVLTALIVENDLKSADLIRLRLEAEGFMVLHAATAEAALALVMQQPLSLITLDIMLPNMDGWEFLGRLKQVPHLRTVPVLIISIVADRNKGFALGAAAVMQKPISRNELRESLLDLGLLPLSEGRTLKVLVVDDDPKAVELIAIRMVDMASTVLRAYGGREAIEAATRERPDLIVLDLMMPEVNGFEVVEALQAHPDTARIPILVVTAKRITTEDRAKLNGSVTKIMGKAEFDRHRFAAEVRRAMSGRRVAA
jgi:signal transduction histidine kinase/DNA-binding response OmpR family regulator